jgi:hypothetical protein
MRKLLLNTNCQVKLVFSTNLKTSLLSLPAACGLGISVYVSIVSPVRGVVRGPGKPLAFLLQIAGRDK